MELDAQNTWGESSFFLTSPHPTASIPAESTNLTIGLSLSQPPAGLELWTEGKPYAGPSSASRISNE